MKKLLPLLFLLASVPALAQEKLSVTAIPPRLELEALPGATVQETLRVRNESAEDQAFLVVVKDFIVTGNQGTPIPVDETVSGLPAGKAGRWSLASWITVSPKQLLVPAGETRAIDITVSVPKNGLPGGHYAMVTYAPVTEGTMAGTGTAISPQVGSLIYLKVIGDVTEAVNLKEFKVKNKFAYYGPIQLLAEIENLGDIHLRPKGKLTVSNWLKDEVFKEDLEEKNIFPFASRTYNWTVPGKWRLGRYAARLTTQSGEAQIPLNGLIYFWIVPVRELAVAGTALLLLITLIVFRKRRQNYPPDALVPENPHLA